MDPICLGYFSYTCRQFLKSVPLKGMASSQNFFVWVPWGLNLLEGLIPYRTKSCRYQIPQNKILWGVRPCRTKSYRVSDSAEQWQSCVHFITDACSPGSDTPQNNVLSGLIPRLTKSCKVSYPVEQSPGGINPREQLSHMNISVKLKQS
jgi:hypothetical protein